MPLRWGKAVLSVGAEVTWGTYLEPVGAGALQAFDCSYAVESNNFERNDVIGHFGKLNELPGLASGTITAKSLLYTSGVAGTATGMTQSMLACGMRQQDVAAPAALNYVPWSTFGTVDAGEFAYPKNGYSVALFVDGVQFAIAGAFGNMSLTATVGEPITMDWTFKGAYFAFSDEAAPPALSVSTTSPPRFVGATCTIGAFTGVVKSLSIDLGNVIAMSNDANNANGVKGAVLTNRRVTGSISLDMETFASKDFFGTWRAGTVQALSTVLGTAGNRVTITATSCIFRPPTIGNVDSLMTIDIPFAISSSTEGGDFTIKLD